MSCATDLSPTAIFSPVYMLSGAGSMYTLGMVRWGEVYPGYGVVGDWVGAGRGNTGYPARTIPGPIFNSIQEISPTHGQMKAFSCYL